MKRVESFVFEEWLRVMKTMALATIVTCFLAFALGQGEVSKGTKKELIELAYMPIGWLEELIDWSAGLKGHALLIYLS